MSLIVTFNGQFKPYQPEKVQHSDRLKQIAQVAPTFNDLIHHYLDEATIEEQVDKKSKNENIKKNKTSSSAIKSYEQTIKKPRKRFYARDIMSTDIKNLTPSHTINDALQLIGREQFHHIPICRDNIMVGILSDRLLLDALASGKKMETELSEIMIQKILTAREHTSLADIARGMLNEKISCLPITDDKLHLKGIITTSDILSLLILSFPLEVYA